MAMIPCPECGQEVSDRAKQCIHCGKVLIEEIAPKKFCSECGREMDVTDDVTECPFCGCPIEEVQVLVNKTSSRMKMGIVIAAILVVIGITTAIAINFSTPTLSEDEELAYQNAVEMKSMMKDPDSFRLYDEMLLMKRYEEGNIKYIYTVFKYGGANGYGAITTDEAIFKDDKFIMNYADEADKDDSNYSEQLRTKLDIQLALYAMSSDSDTWEVVNIDIEKVKKKMGLE